MIIEAVLLVLALLFLGVIVLLVILAAACMWSEIMGPEFDELGNINECVGCRMDGETCRGCAYNPEYWNGRQYIGPSRKELYRIRRDWRRRP